MMDWDKLRIFHAVADAGSLTHAGDTLHLSQSAVSRQIRALEESLNTILFHRHARGLILTEQGELLFKALKQSPRFKQVPVGMMSAIIGGLSLLGLVSAKLREKAELARIGHYYATESMLVLDPETGEMVFFALIQPKGLKMLSIRIPDLIRYQLKKWKSF